MVTARGVRSQTESLSRPTAGDSGTDGVGHECRHRAPLGDFRVERTELDEPVERVGARVGDVDPIGHG